MIVATPYIFLHVCKRHTPHQQTYYGVATISRLLKITGLFCKRALSKGLYSAKETYDFKEPTNCSHPIYLSTCLRTTYSTPTNTLYTALCIFTYLRACMHSYKCMHVVLTWSFVCAYACGKEKECGEGKQKETQKE